MPDIEVFCGGQRIGFITSIPSHIEKLPESLEITPDQLKAINEVLMTRSYSFSMEGTSEELEALEKELAQLLTKPRGVKKPCATIAPAARKRKNELYKSSSRVKR